MDTHFEFTCLLFLSRATFKYQQSSFRAARFDLKLTNSELEQLFKEIYSRTNNFQHLKTYHKRQKGSSVTFILVCITMLLLLVTAFSGFMAILFFLFAITALITAFVILFHGVLDNYYLRKSRDYEDVVIDVLHEWNQKYLDKGIKFSIMRSYYVLMIHADYKKPDFKYNLLFGKRIFDKKGKLIKPKAEESKDKRGNDGASRGPRYINRNGEVVAPPSNQ